MKSGAASACLVLLFIMTAAAPLCAAERADGFTRKQKAFILELFNTKDYFSCIAETRRLLAYVPDTPLRNELLYFIEANYFLGAQYKTVVSNLSPGVDGSGVSGPGIFLVSSSYLMLGMRRESGMVLSAHDYISMEEPLRHELLVRRIEFYLADSNYGDAVNEIERARRAGLTGARIDGLAMDLAEYTEIRQKSALGAASLSAVIPGSGQVYAGRYADGVISFISMAALLAGTAVSYRSGERGVAFTLGFFSALVYAGTIYGAWNAAGNFNRAGDADFRSTITARHIPPFDPVKYIDQSGMLR